MLKKDIWRRIYNYWFRHISIESVLADQRYDAQRRYVEHQAAAEHHQALANMYRGRIERLDAESVLPSTSITLTPVARSRPLQQRAA